MSIQKTLLLMTPQQKDAFTNYMEMYNPQAFAYYSRIGEVLKHNNNEKSNLGGLFDLLRDGGNFVSGLFGNTAQNFYQDFVNYEETGNAPNSGKGISQQQMFLIQQKADQDLKDMQDKANANQKNLLIFGGIGLAVVAFLALKK